MIVKNIDDFKGLRAVNRMAVFLSVFLPRSKGIQELTELLYSGFPQVTVSSVASNAGRVFCASRTAVMNALPSARPGRLRR